MIKQGIKHADRENPFLRLKDRDRNTLRSQPHKGKEEEQKTISIQELNPKLKR